MTEERGGALLEVRGLAKRYRGFALEGVDLRVEPGEVVGLVGTNGAGKTTLIKSALGLVRPDAGEALLFGYDVGTHAADPGLKRRVGVVFDGVSFPGAVRVADVHRIMRAAYSTWDDKAFSVHLEKFGLDGGRRVAELSRGMGMKLMLACALSHAAELLILDEATAGLDPMAREEVLDVLRDFMAQEGRGILLATHITSDLEHIADRVVCLDAGRVAFSLEKDRITDEAGVARCRASEFEDICACGAFEGAHYARHEMSVDVLVADRRSFARRFPQVAVDRASIEEYMALVLKGSQVGIGPDPSGASDKGACDAVDD